jgi:hypothetical protein
LEPLLTPAAFLAVLVRALARARALGLAPAAGEG